MNNKPWATLAPGVRWQGWWQPDDAELTALPVLAARGLHDGPTVLVTGAVHGDEYEGPAAIHHLFQTVDLSQLHGRVMGLPIVNVAAYHARARVTPADGMDLNRTFPGVADPQASLSRRLAHAIFSNFVQMCDVLIDLHSGGAKLVHLPLVGWYVGDNRAEQMARAFHPALHPWLIPAQAGVLSYEAHRAGKAAIGAEWGGGARLDNAGVAAYAAGIRRLLHSLHQPTQASCASNTAACIAGSYQEVAQGGLFVAAVELGARVQAGDLLGTLYDELGATVAQVTAARAGLVAALAHNALLHPGDRVAYV
ncbi:MAG: succinylglutamate desuccinylase/aspartoacylase family protein [Caldilineaceae bacterium]|nr:succinylglutamate desuccinylase/aspartoacylase family protein [Caldilineaceae bacterium]